MSESPGSPHGSERKVPDGYRPLVGALEAEQAVLGVFLQKPALFPEIRSKLGEGQYLTDTRTRVIYSAACELDDSGQLPDCASVVCHIRTKKLLDQAGGLGYIDDLLSPKYCFPSLVDQHCEQIRQAYIRSVQERDGEWKPKSILKGYGPMKTVNLLLAKLGQGKHFHKGSTPKESKALEASFMNALSSEIDC